MNSRLRIPALTVALLAACAGLTACAPAATPTAAPTVASTSGGSAAMTPTATPTPAPTTVADPVSRLPLGCDDLLSTAVVDTTVGSSAVVLQRDEDAAPTSVSDIAARQNGTLQCVWGGKYQTDGGYDDGLTLEIAVDAADAYAHYVPLFDAQSRGTPVVNTVGAKSEYLCGGGSNEFWCTGNMLVGTTWVSIGLQDSSKPGATVAVAKTRMQKTMTTVATELASITVLPAWNAPASTVSPFCANVADHTAAVRRLLAAPKLKIDDLSDQFAKPDASVTASSANAIVSCGWNGEGYLGVDELPNGAWAMPTLVADPPLLEGIGTYVPVTVTGADSALFVHGGEGASSAIFTIGANLYDISFNEYGTKKDTAILDGIVAAIAG